MRKPLRFCSRCALRDNAVAQTYNQSFLSPDWPAGENQIQGPAHAE
jgi:hypothetical protein